MVIFEAALHILAMVVIAASVSVTAVQGFLKIQEKVNPGESLDPFWRMAAGPVFLMLWMASSIFSLLYLFHSFG